MAHRAAGRGSGDGIDRAILEACLGSAGAIWKAMCQSREGAGRMSGTLHLNASLVQSRAAQAKDRFSRRRTFGEAARITEASLELRTRCRTTPVANTNPHKVSTDA